MCARGLGIILHTFEHLRAPVRSTNLKGPTTALTFLDIDTVALQLRLPQSKLGELRQLVATCKGERLLPSRGAGIFDWEAATCLHSCQARLVVPTPPLRVSIGYREASPLTQRIGHTSASEVSRVIPSPVRSCLLTQFKQALYIHEQPLR